MAFLLKDRKTNRDCKFLTLTFQTRSTFSSCATQTRITDFHKAEEDYISVCDVIKNGSQRKVRVKPRSGSVKKKNTLGFLIVKLIGQLEMPCLTAKHILGALAAFLTATLHLRPFLMRLQ